METSLHRELKERYADSTSEVEFRVGNYRIDALRGGELVEIQHGSLAAIRDKVKRLLKSHRVLVVKPIVVEKRIIRCAAKSGRVLGRRRSPKRGSPIALFDELVYFVKLFPHPNLVIETPLVDVDEWRYPGHGRRRRWRKNDFQVEDLKLVAVRGVLRYETRADLLRWLPGDLPDPFDTSKLASALEIPRWDAQRIAYCLRETGAVLEVGKAGNRRLYERQAA